MNNLNYLRLIVAITLLSFMNSSCSGGSNKNQSSSPENTEEVKQAPAGINSEAQALLKYLEESGDYVNSRNYPSLIKASKVYEELGKNIHVIDLRGSESYKEGHIKGAVKVEFSDLPRYFTEDIKPSEFDKVVLVCYSGQISSYAASLLQLMGYSNVYAIRWGMSGWNKDFAYQWNDEISSDYENKLEKTDNQSGFPGDFPKLNTGKTSGKEIFDTRIKQLFEAGFPDAIIKAEKVIANPSEFYIVNLIRKDKYESGHIPGSIRYKPNGTLGIIPEMQTIPNNKSVVVYCETGQTSSFAVAYLRLFGYNAHTLIYGSNAFMHDKMVAEKNTLSWTVFTDDEIENFPYVK
ncbi:MAG: rhodanese-like domain-containing protein [Draconibacterium sp.]